MRMSAQEPPSRPHSGRFTVGRDAEGNWIVQDRMGLVGGLFADRESAVHFALVESDRVPGAVCCAPDDQIMRMGAIFEPIQRQRRAIRHH
jgi:hypothetical protein